MSAWVALAGGARAGLGQHYLGSALFAETLQDKVAGFQGDQWPPRPVMLWIAYLYADHEMPDQKR